jgi:hypothetical protein
MKYLEKHCPPPEGVKFEIYTNAGFRGRTPKFPVSCSEYN